MIGPYFCRHLLFLAHASTYCDITVDYHASTGKAAGLGFAPRWVNQLRSGTLDAEARTRFWEPLDQPFMRFILESANPATVPIHSRQGNSARTGLCLRPCPFDKRIMGVKVRNLERPDEGMERGENERAEPS